MGKHKEWRKLAKKFRRKAIRQRTARQKHTEEANAQIIREKSPTYQAWLHEQEELEEYERREAAKLLQEQHTKWLKDEESAQEHWKQLQIQLEQAREERAKQTARIREEWEREQRKLRELKEQKEKEEEDKRIKEEELRNQISHFIEHGGDVPEGLQTNFETNPLKQICPFFTKTGACRFKDTCTRNHVRPRISRVLLVPGFYSHYSLQQTDTEYGNDSSLEYETKETYQHFKQFFNDVLPELEKCGIVRQFKVCCNREVHLRGNVFIEYDTLREALISYQKFHGRWYGGKQLNVEFSNIVSWKSAICGLFANKRCPKGSACNFLHVFRNPGKLFINADRDLHRTPQEHSGTPDVEERRNWRWSESPEPFSYPNSSKSTNYKKHSKRKRHDSDNHQTPRHRKESKRKYRTPEKQTGHKFKERNVEKRKTYS